MGRDSDASGGYAGGGSDNGRDHQGRSRSDHDSGRSRDRDSGRSRDRDSGRSRDVPKGFGGTDNVDGTSTAGYGETNTSQNGGRGDWGRDSRLNGNHSQNGSRANSANTDWKDKYNAEKKTKATNGGGLLGRITDSITGAYNGALSMVNGDIARVNTPAPDYYGATVDDYSFKGEVLGESPYATFGRTAVDEIAAMKSEFDNKADLDGAIVDAYNHAERNKTVDIVSGIASIAAGPAASPLGSIFKSGVDWVNDWNDKPESQQALSDALEDKMNGDGLKNGIIRGAGSMVGQVSRNIPMGAMVGFGVDANNLRNFREEAKPARDYLGISDVTPTSPQRRHESQDGHGGLLANVQSIGKIGNLAQSESDLLSDYYDRLAWAEIPTTDYGVY